VKFVKYVEHHEIKSSVNDQTDENVLAKFQVSRLLFYTNK
jgi:hypothetical protein